MCTDGWSRKHSDYKYAINTQYNYALTHRVHNYVASSVTWIDEHMNDVQLGLYKPPQSTNIKTTITFSFCCQLKKKKRNLSTMQVCMNVGHATFSFFLNNALLSITLKLFMCLQTERIDYYGYGRTLTIERGCALTGKCRYGCKFNYYGVTHMRCTSCCKTPICNTDNSSAMIKAIQLYVIVLLGVVRLSLMAD